MTDIKCKKCNQTKHCLEFYKSKITKSGYHGSCKICMNERSRNYSKENSQKIKAYKRDYYLKDRPKHDARTKKWFSENKGKFTEYSKTWMDRNPLKRDAHNKVYCALKKGDILKPISCSCCGIFTESLHAHHDDYSEPLSIRWLCSQCHADWHHSNVAKGC